MRNQADTVLVAMPYAHVVRPSIALGILKSCLLRAGISCAVEYANLRFAEKIGLEVNSLMMQMRTDALIGEWTFAQAAFRDYRDNLSGVLGSARSVQPGNLPAGSLDEREFRETFEQLRRFAPIFIEETVELILERDPRIVGCSSTFEQHCAALALLRRVKERAPHITTLLGGANCETEMGWATLRNCPWVDHIVSGEAEELIVPLCRGILEGHFEEMPPGLLSQQQVTQGRTASFAAGKLPRAVLAQMDHSPEPDFSDYFEELAASPIRKFIQPALAVESSRGCWWGAKSHCTFCGLNGSGMNYRSKSSEQVLAEWESLTALHGVRKMTVVDNIIDLKHIRELLPQLSSAPGSYELFYEVKANLCREQVELMSRAGVTKFQPGIEGLHDDLLRLMAKGNSATINLELLKYARDYGIMTTWMLLVGFPGEDPEWHREVANWLPLVIHLQPPNGVVHIRYDRFSVYFEKAAEYGLQLEPFPNYQEVYPFPPEDLRDLAYFFYDANQGTGRKPHAAVEELGARVKDWIIAHGREIPPVFCYDDDGSALHFFDTRPCATQRRVAVAGLEREIYLACDTSKTRKVLRQRFSELSDESAVDQAITRLVAQRLMLEVHGRILSLANAGSVPTLGTQRDYPNGYIEKYDPTHFDSAMRAWASLKHGSPRLKKLIEAEAAVIV